jgi:hypothetical protein
MSTDKITTKIKNLLKKHNFTSEIVPQISSSICTFDRNKSYNEEIQLTLKEQGCTDDSKKLKIILNGVRNDDNTVEYTIGAMMNTPINCSIFKGTVIKKEREINYYLNALLRKLKNK